MNNWNNGGKIKQLLICYLDGGGEKAFMKEELNLFEQLRRQGIAVLSIPVLNVSSTRVETMPIDYENRDPVEIASPDYDADDNNGTFEIQETTLDEIMNIEGLTGRYKENDDEE